ncbi:MAG: von Willebrand factor type A domain-containing protein, partial [Clostridia bacterium]|nr:von Willebrand factor type A domain-containing protein [Clostridia bacterium]
MKNNAYRNAMDQVPFSDNLEAKTIAMLEAASESNRKETETMIKKEFFHWRKRLTIGGSALAAAACLLLVVLPLLRNGIESGIPLNASLEADRPASTSYAATIADTPTATQAQAITQTKPPSAAGSSVPQEAEAVHTMAGGGALYEHSANEPTAAEWSDWDSQALPPQSAAYRTRIAAIPSQWNTEEYSRIQENRFHSARTTPLSTFAADVDTASYAKLRSAILAGGNIPADSVRIEE